MMHPFTAAQLQELELQALIFNYIALGIPIPKHFVLPFRRSLYLDPFSLHLSMGYNWRKTEEDPEPWRCRRTDGKKWRCSGEVCGESKFCERHKHRGKRPLNLNSISSLASPPLASLASKNSDDLSLRKEKEKHCFVFGADLKLQKPANESREAAQSLKLRLGFFGDDYLDKINEELGSQYRPQDVEILS